MFFYIDWTYVIFVIPAIILSIFASAMVSATFNKYSKINSTCGLTAAQVARQILDKNGLTDVKIEHVRGNLTDHYDPRRNVIRLSESTYYSTSSAAIGVATHEVGHVLQYYKKYLPIKIRQAIIPATRIGSQLAIPLIILGVFLSTLGEHFCYIAYAGIALFGLSVLFQLITLPVEFNASKRAIKQLSSNNILTKEELGHSKKVLTAAAMTYVAALTVSVMQLLRLLLIVSRRSKRN